jgi:acyl-CoA oxidase
MKKEQLGLEDGITMRSLLDFPGGLELHIGVSLHGLLAEDDD